VWLRLGKSRIIAALLGLTGSSIAVGWGLYSSGGLDNPASGWLLAMPLVGGLIGGLWGGVFGIIYSFVVTGILLYLQNIYGAPEDLTPLAFQEGQKRMHQFGVLTIISLSIISLFRQIRFADEQLSVLFSHLAEEVDARKEAEEEAEKASRVKSEFLANMSHEIRTPMNGIVGVLELMSNDQLCDENKHHLEIAKASARNLLVIINDILDLSKIESGKLSIESVPFNIETLVQELLALMALKAQKKAISLGHTISLSQAMIVSDPTRIRQVLENLLSNAIKFTHEGQIDLDVRLDARDSRYGMLKIAVRDTGIGMSDQALKEIFMPFHQAQTSTTREYGGTGLGLTISRNLVELMGGALRAESQQGQGSEFTIELPVNLPHPKVAPETILEETSTAPLCAPESTCHVLLVEDNEINIQVALAMLQRFPVTVDVARNGREALAQIEQADKDYDLIFMDCQMPEMDGYEASRALTQNPNRKTPPIVAMTANAMKGDKEKCMAAGMSDYIAKPVLPEVLQSKIEKWTGIRCSPVSDTPD